MTTSDSVRPYSFPEFGAGTASETARPIESIAQVTMSLAAVARAMPVSLHQIASWQPGDIVELLGEPDDPIMLDLNGEPIGTGHMVVDNNVMSVRVAGVRADNGEGD